MPFDKLKCTEDIHSHVVNGQKTVFLAFLASFDEGVSIFPKRWPVITEGTIGSKRGVEWSLNSNHESEKQKTQTPTDNR